MRSLFFLVLLVLAFCLPPYLMKNQNGRCVPQDVKDNITKDSKSLVGDIVELGKSIFCGSNTSVPQESAPPATENTQIYDNGKIYIKVWEPGLGWRYIPNPYNDYWKQQ